MHVHACYDIPMRTTIEIDDRHRAELLRIASIRGINGFSSIVREALEQYLKDEGQHVRRRQAALSAQGSVSEQEAEELLRSVRHLRESWR